MAGRIFVVLCAALLAGSTAFAAQDQFVRVEVKGTLHNDADGRRASLQSGDFNFSLDFGNDPGFWRFAERLDRKEVIVRGHLSVFEGRGPQPMLVIDARRIEDARASNVSFERFDSHRHEAAPRREVIVKEEHDPPVVKLPFVEIND